DWSSDVCSSDLNIQKSFIGTPALHHERGLTHFDEYLVSAKKRMILAAKQIIVVADHTKLDRVSLHTVAGLNNINDLVIGTEIEEKQLKKWKNTGVQLHLA